MWVSGEGPPSTQSPGEQRRLGLCRLVVLAAVPHSILSSPTPAGEHVTIT